MKYITELSQAVLDRDSVVTLGKFDGLHLGHRRLFEDLKRIKEEKGLETVVFTFDQEIMFFKYGPRFQSILEKPERLEKFRELDPDLVVECPFDDRIRLMEAETFVREILVHNLRAKCIVVGKDFRFGHDRRGCYEMLLECAKKYGFCVQLIDDVFDEGRRISSSRIRECIQNGDMEAANRMLGYDFFVEGEILHGNEIGRTIDMPTINLLPAQGKLLPPFGVYASYVEMDGQTYKGVTNIGRKPTIGDYAIGVETHIFHVSGDFYGKIARVSMLKHMRPERKFGSVDELKNQMHQDMRNAQAYLDEIG